MALKKTTKILLKQFTKKSRFKRFPAEKKIRKKVAIASRARRKKIGLEAARKETIEAFRKPK